MKKGLALMLCLLLCLAAACVKPAPAEEPKPEAPVSEAGQTEDTEVSEPVQVNETPAADEPVQETATEAPEEDHSGDIELPQLGTDDAQPQSGALTFDTVTLNGDAITSDIMKDYDLVILNYWAEWCGPCVGELPALEQIHQEYPNVLILGAWFGDPEDTDSLNEAKTLLSDVGVTYPTVVLNGMLDTYGGLSMYIPATYFFDGTGKEIGEPVIGSQEYDAWKQIVDSLLA